MEPDPVPPWLQYGEALRQAFGALFTLIGFLVALGVAVWWEPRKARKDRVGRTQQGVEEAKRRRVSVIFYSPSMNGNRPESAGYLWEWWWPKYVAAPRNNWYRPTSLRTVGSESIGRGFDRAARLGREGVARTRFVAICGDGPPGRRNDAWWRQTIVIADTAVNQTLALCVIAL